MLSLEFHDCSHCGKKGILPIPDNRCPYCWNDLGPNSESKQVKASDMQEEELRRIHEIILTLNEALILTPTGDNIEKYRHIGKLLIEQKKLFNSTAEFDDWINKNLPLIAKKAARYIMGIYRIDSNDSYLRNQKRHDSQSEDLEDDSRLEIRWQKLADALPILPVPDKCNSCGSTGKGQNITFHYGTKSYSGHVLIDNFGVRLVQYPLCNECINQMVKRKLKRAALGLVLSSLGLVCMITIYLVFNRRPLSALFYPMLFLALITCILSIHFSVMKKDIYLENYCIKLWMKQNKNRDLDMTIWNSKQYKEPVSE